MELKDVLKKPLITEKMNAISEKFTIKLMYGVEPIDVNTSILPGKPKSKQTKSGYTKGHTQARKKAVVTLAEGDSIDFFNNI